MKLLYKVDRKDKICNGEDGSNHGTPEIVMNIRKEFFEDRTLILNEDVDDSAIETIVLPIIKWNIADDIKAAKEKDFKRSSDPITIFINSYGGNALECLSIISAIDSSKTPVITITLGKAYSAGAMIALAGHVRLAQKYSNFMIHNMICGAVPNNIEAVEDKLVQSRAIQEDVNAFLLRKTKLTKKQIIALTGREWYFNTEEAIKFKMIDGVI